MHPQRRTALVSVAAAAVLVLLKLVTGLASGSLGLALGGAPTGATDLVAALLHPVRRRRCRAACRPPPTRRPREGGAPRRARRGDDPRHPEPGSSLGLAVARLTRDCCELDRGRRLVDVPRARGRDRDRREPHDRLAPHGLGVLSASAGAGRRTRSTSACDLARVGWPSSPGSPPRRPGTRTGESAWLRRSSPCLVLVAVGSG